MKKKGKIRADELVLKNGLCESRTQAQACILAGQIKLGTEKIDKASKMLNQDSELTLVRPPPFVGRGGLKLESFFKNFPLAIRDRNILDLGASTGGFSDYLLQQGAKTATCVDVGHGQLHYKLRTDKRVTNLEKTNLRNLSPDRLPFSPFPIVVMDLSFISLTKVLVRAWSFLDTGGHLIALIKPQFECKKKEADLGRGIIKDELIHKRVLQDIIDFANQNLANSELFAQTESSPKGADGNLEFFLGWKKKG
ncbi:MAG: TlyA family RNA methyltransferase [Opitutales bacterium]|nr:TlyA family RNA methyltransferase [Opitutales bacterium]MDG1326583.1 TlyA family RNA methyltransferase [Opitutales bacterium]